MASWAIEFPGEFLSLFMGLKSSDISLPIHVAGLLEHADCTVQYFIFDQEL